MKQDGYKTICEAIEINEISKKLVRKVAGGRIIKNLLKDPVFYTGVAASPTPLPWGVYPAVGVHMARNKKSQQAARILAKKYNIKSGIILKLMGQKAAKKAKVAKKVKTFKAPKFTPSI